MIRVNFNAYGSYVTDSLYQWDKNVVLVINGLNLTEAPEIHFANVDMERAIVRQSTLTEGVVTVRIPNSLLQVAYTIKAYIGIYEGETFKVVETIEIPITAKAKPMDYTISGNDQDVYSFNALDNRISNIIANANSTEGNSELVDIRQDYKGNTHTSAGDAIRAQFRELDEEITKLDENKVDKSSIVQTTGDSENNVISQKVVTEELGKKVDTQNIVQKTGNSESSVMSQRAVTAEIERIVDTTVTESHNILNKNEFTDGYVALTGSVASSTALSYTKPIPVVEGDIIRIYIGEATSDFRKYSARFITAYKDGVAKSSKGAENTTTYTVPSGVDSIVISALSNLSMITKNYEATGYERYFEPIVDTKIKDSVLPIASEATYGVCRIWTTIDENGKTVLNIATEG